MKRLSPTKLTVIAFLGAGCVDGALAAFAPRSSLIGPVEALSTLALSVATFAWFRIDADSRGYPRARILSVAIIGVTLFALPYYLFRTRGLMRGALATGGAILITFLPLVGAMIGAIAVQLART